MDAPAGPGGGLGSVDGGDWIVPPQRGQKAKSGGDTLPQEAHVAFNALPHLGQNAKSIGASYPQASHVVIRGPILDHWSTSIIFGLQVPLGQLP